MSAPWPFFDLRIRTDRMELRYPCDDDLAALAAVAAAGVHDPAEMPFVVPWTASPPGVMERELLQYHWRIRAELRPEDWNLELVAVEGGRVVGAQGIRASRFAQDRTVVTGSWLGRAHQGRGLGRAMREAVLHLAFEGLGARTALSGAFADNVRSRRVSLSLGYQQVESAEVLSRGVPRPHHRFRLERAEWLARQHPPVAVEGLAACLPLLGLAGSPAGG